MKEITKKRPDPKDYDYQPYGFMHECVIYMDQIEADFKKVVKQRNELLKALIGAYKCSGERNYLSKPVLDDMAKAIKKATE